MYLKISLPKWVILSICLVSSSTFLLAQSKEEIKPITAAYAITNTNVITSPGNMMEGVHIILENGVIKRIGKDLPIPPNAEVIKADSMFVYAGFIEGLSYTGVPKPETPNTNRSSQTQGNRPSGPNVKDPGNPPNDLAGIQPEVLVKDKLKPTDKSISEKRKLGFTTAHVVPQGLMLPGSGAVILLHGGQVDDMIIKEESSLFTQFSPARRIYPATTIGVISKWKELYRQAKINKAYQDRYSENNLGLPRPKFDRTQAAFFPVIEGKKPVFFKTEDVLSIHRALTLKKELDFPIVLAEVKQGAPVMNQIKKWDIPVLISLDLPDEPKEKKEDKKADDPEKKEADDDPIKKQLEERQKQSIEEYTGQASLFAKNDIRFGFSTLTLKDKDFKKNISRMIKAGLTEDQALAALTTNPAEMLGLSHLMGTVEEGKMANLVISNQPYFNEKAQVAYVFVDGQPTKYDIKKEKEKKNSGTDKEAAPANILGTWTYNIEVPGQSSDGTFTISGDDGDYKGNITNTQMEEEVEMNNIVIEGNALSFTMDIEMGGQNMTLDYILEMDGDNFEGDVSVGDFGTFPMEGKRIADPDKN